MVICRRPTAPFPAKQGNSGNSCQGDEKIELKSAGSVRGLCLKSGKYLNNFNVVWRRGRDSNPRCPCEHAAFRVRCIRPLCHLSAVMVRRCRRGALDNGWAGRLQGPICLISGFREPPRCRDGASPSGQGVSRVSSSLCRKQPAWRPVMARLGPRRYGHLP